MGDLAGMTKQQSIRECKKCGKVFSYPGSTEKSLCPACWRTRKRSPKSNLANTSDAIISITERLGFKRLSDLELLQGYAGLMGELRSRGILRTANNPVADYTEWLVCRALGLDQQANSNAGYDGVCSEGKRYEIKSRRVTQSNGSVQLSALRNLDAANFDYLVGVIYESDFSIRYGAKVPHRLIAPNSRFSAHSNAHFFHLRPDVLKLPGVEDVTDVLATAIAH
jgi:hypothetical protein